MTEPADEAGGVAEGLSRGRHPIILVAENEPHHRFVLRRVFRTVELDVDLRFVNDGIELLAYLEQAGEFAKPAAAPWPDLVLMDLHMPRLDGIGALQAMRARRRLRTIPTIMFSSSNQPHHIDDAYASGANAYLVKVGDFRELVAHLRGMIAFWLKAARLPRPPEQQPEQQPGRQPDEPPAMGVEP